MADEDDLTKAMDEANIPAVLKSFQGHGGGPVKIEISETEVKMMAMFMCPLFEIASFYNLSERQLYRRFVQEPELRTAFQMGRAQGRRMLRRKQFLVAVAGDVAMLKWLGQNVLGQSAKVSIMADNLNPAEMDDAIDAEFEEIYEAVDEELQTNGHGGEDQQAGNALHGTVEGPGQNTAGDLEGAGNPS